MVTTTTQAVNPQVAPLLDARGAGLLLGVPATWLLAEARRDRVPHVRLGRYVRFRRDALLRWVEERERGPVRTRAATATHEQ